MKALRRAITKTRSLMHDIQQTSRLSQNTLATLHRQSEYANRKLGEITALLQNGHGSAAASEHIPQASPTSYAPDTARAFFNDNGYYIFRHALPEAAVNGVQDAIKKEFIPSREPHLRHCGSTPTPRPHEYIESASGEWIVSNGLLDPHLMTSLPMLQKAIRNLVCTDAVADLLAAIDGEERNFTVHQTILFTYSPGTDMHIDGWGVDSWPRGRSYTIWIPLEPVYADSGALYLAPWKVGNFIDPDTLGLKDFFQRATDHPADAFEDYQTALNLYMRERNIAFVLPQFAPGDFVLFSSLTPHGTMPFRIRPPEGLPAPTDTYPADLALKHRPKPPSRFAVQVILRATNRDWTWSPGGFAGQYNAPDTPDCVEVVNDRWKIFLPPIHRKA